MRSISRSAGVFLLTAATLIAGCQTIPVEVKEAPKLQAVEIDNPDNLAPIKLSRVGVNIRRGTVVGSYMNDPFMCAGGANNLFWNQGPVKIDESEFAALFYETLSDANFNVLGNPDKLFENAERERIKPEYLVGGQIEDIRMNVCEERDWWTGRPRGAQKGSASVHVTWQVFSVFDKKVVYQTQSDGSVKLETAVAGGEGVLLTEAFADAVANLAGNKELVDFLGNKARTFADVRDIDAETLAIAARPASETPITDDIDLIRRSVVTLDSGPGHGSGFFISPTLILTNYHVVANEDLLRVHLITGRKVLGEVIRRHPERDVALVQVEPSGHRPLPLRLDPVKITEEVYAIGSPLSKRLSGTVSKGIVSKFNTNRYGLEDIQADVDIHGGNSGGPLLDGKGNVVGLTYAGIGDVGLNFFIPIYDALDKLNVILDDTRGKVVTN